MRLYGSIPGNDTSSQLQLPAGDILGLFRGYQLGGGGGRKKYEVEYGSSFNSFPLLSRLFGGG